MSNKDHKSTGIEYTYFTMHTLLGMAIFFFWSSLTNLFANFGLDLFYELFITMFFSGILARSVSYLLLWYFTRKAKGMVPSFYKITFQKNINRMSLITITALLLFSLIYAYGINVYITEYFFEELSTDAFSMLFSYLFIKIGTQVVAWIFLKTRA